MFFKKKEKELNNTQDYTQEIDLNIPKNEININRISDEQEGYNQALKEMDNTVDYRKAAILYDVENEYIPETVDEVIRYNKMFDSGICEVIPNIYSLAIKFYDTNYSDAKEEQQEDLFIRLCETYNRLGTDVGCQLFLSNKFVTDDIIRSLLPPDKSEFFTYRQEMTDLILNRAKRGGGNVIKNNQYIITVHAEDYPEAEKKLLGISKNLMKDLQGMGCICEEMDGKQRLEVMHDMNSIDKPFVFDYSELDGVSNRTTKDYISPSLFEFNENNYQAGDIVGQTLLLSQMGNELSDTFVKDLRDIPHDISISVHIDIFSDAEAVRETNKRVGLLNSEKSAKLKSIARDVGIPDDSMLSEKLKDQIDYAKELRDDVQNSNQKLFNITFLVNVRAENLDKLKQAVSEVFSVGRRHSCVFDVLTKRQESALNSVYPIGVNRLKNKRLVNTSAVGVLVPFTSQEILERNGYMYGTNTATGNLIYLNRKNLPNGNGFYVGSSGFGKSFDVKVEILNILLNTDDEIIIIDPENEFVVPVQALKGQNIEISSNTDTYINFFDMDLNYSDGKNPIPEKVSMIIAAIGIMTNQEEVSGIRQSVIDRSVNRIYKKYLETKDINDMPTFKDFYDDILNNENENEEAMQMLKEIAIYVTGSLDLFAHKTNVEINNRLVNFGLANMPSNLKHLGIFAIYDHIWNRLAHNRTNNKRTWIFWDEIQTTFNYPYALDIVDEGWSRGRKWGALWTGITQNLERIVRIPKVSNMLSNSEFVMILGQSAQDRAVSQDLFDLSDNQMEYLKKAKNGSGLVRYGGSIIPISNEIPSNTEMYKIMTTKPGEFL